MNKNKFLNSNELKQLEELLYKHLKDDTRNCLLLLLAIKTGSRASELLAIKKTDLDKHNKTVYIRGLKGSDSLEMPLPTKLFNELYRYSNTVIGDFIFPISYERFVQIFKHYKSTPHSLKALRHTFALELYKKSKDIRLVQQALKHKAISSTEKYQTYLYTQEQLRKFIR
jgi:integrase/recombinase XerC